MMLMPALRQNLFVLDLSGKQVTIHYFN